MTFLSISICAVYHRSAVRPLLRQGHLVHGGHSRQLQGGRARPNPRCTYSCLTTYYSECPTDSLHLACTCLSAPVLTVLLTYLPRRAALRPPAVTASRISSAPRTSAICGTRSTLLRVTLALGMRTLHTPTAPHAPQTGRHFHASKPLWYQHLSLPLKPYPHGA